MSTQTNAMNRAQIASRIAAALLGGYAFTWGSASLLIVSLVAADLDFHDAEHGAMLLAFLVYLAAFLWTFAVARASRAWLVLMGGGLSMTALAWALQGLLLA